MGLFGPSGKIQIQLNTFQYSAGETIEGKVTLQLKEPTTARGVFITLQGVEESGSGKNSQTKVLFDFKQPLDGEKTYPATPAPLVYPFRITIPSDVFPPTPPLPKDGTLGAVVQFGQMITGMGFRRVKWDLIAKLDVAMKMDLSTSQQLTVSPKS